ncbi:malectin domain-containing carbohydrate-binding protein [Maribacter algarum]|nr:malectin domain-containing carbohydrate-binding protein [Maribacter algarum]
MGITLVKSLSKQSNFHLIFFKRTAFLLLILFLSTSIEHIQAQLPTDFQKVEIASGLSNTTTFKFAPDGRIFILDRYGELLIYKSSEGVPISAGTLPVFHELEDGLLGIAFDPNFSTNNFIYLYYSPAGSAFEGNRVSRFTMNGDNLDLSSEITILQWPTNRVAKYHSGGDMDFDSQGNLYIATGDNTTYPNTYTAIASTNTNTANNNIATAEKSSSNTNDLRGKILRITPQSNGTYTIPIGNLFPGGTGGLAEIYVMGARNPYKIFVDDQANDWLYWGDIGPDAPNASSLGPSGRDELNLTKNAENAGWPYFLGKNNDPYQIVYNGLPSFYNNPLAPVNTSVFNTGAVNLPAAQPAWMDFDNKSYLAGFRYYYDNSLPDAQRLPIEFDEKFFFYDFNSSKIWVVTLNPDGSIVEDTSSIGVVPRFAPSEFPTATEGFIDMELGPDGKMYILAYGVPCCGSDSGPTGKLIRVDFTGIVSNGPPVVQLSATPTNGDLPLVVNFSSAGTIDPDGDSPLTYEWDFDSNGTIDSTEPNPTYTYTTAGTFNAQLRVKDGNPTNGESIKNVTIYAGNNLAEFSINSPANGGFFNWGDDVNIDIIVEDNEEGSIDCNQVILTPGFGHLNHVHPESTLDGCPQTLTLQADANHGTDGELDIFASISMEYTDTGGLISRDLLQLHPKRKEAEFYDTQGGTSIISNNDPTEGGQEALRVNAGGFISFAGRNLQNITAVKYKVAASASGGSIELRLGSETGTLLATTPVPATGGPSNWVNVESNLVDPGGQNDLFFVFNGSGPNIVDLNYVEFIGAGVSIDNSPPNIESFIGLSTTQTLINFNEYISQASAESLSNYSINNGISVLSAVLQSNGRSVLLSYDQLTNGTTYQLTLQNIVNTAGLSITPQVLALSVFDPIAINAGGLAESATPNNFDADQYATGGSLFTNSTAIANTGDDAIYQTERFGNFSYNIPVSESGEYDIRLHFAELYFGLLDGGTGGVGSRIFNVTIEGNPVLTDFDISSEVSPATALQKEFDNISVTDGFVTIEFTSVVENPKVSAIEILPSNTFDTNPNASITINAPSEGNDVNQNFDVSFSVDNWTIAEGNTHMHYFIDDVMVGPHYSYEPISIEGLGLGSHTIKLELFNINHTGTGIFDEVTVNVTSAVTCNSSPFPNQWAVKQLETSSLPYRSVYTFPEHDLDGDGLKDIVTGGWWYKNPGSVSGNWVRNTIGNTFNNVAWVHDFDSDGDMDLLGTTGTYTGADLVWAQNNGSGVFTVFSNIPSGNTTYSEPFLAGIAGGVFTVGGPYQMAINWNGAEATGSPMQMLTPTVDPTSGIWSLVDIPNAVSTGEDLQVGDIDQDNDLDLFQGVNWVRNNGSNGWETFSTGISYVTTPDRAQLADFDKDGDLDAVVGQLGLGSSSSERNQLAWFEAPSDPTQPWIRRVLDTDVRGSLSVSAADIDFDGDKDIIVGEWLGQYRLLAFENDLCDSGTFVKRTINSGIAGQEHHDGARVIDIDNDGDLDIVSNGWVNNFPRIYENTSILNTQSPTADAGSNQSIDLPTSSITLNGTGTDPDGGSITGYEWTQQSGPNTASLSGATTTELTADNLVEGTYVFRLTVTDDEDETGFDEVSVTVNPEVIPGGFTLRINTGGVATNYSGEDFIADQFSDTGSTLDRPQTGLPEPYQSFRFSRSQVMGYAIPVTDGEYTVRLHFAELWFGATGGGTGGVGSRVFDVSIEGQLVEDDLDVFAEVGADAMLVKTHTVNVTGGVLNIDFSALAAVGGNRHPIINAIEVLGTGSTSQTPMADAGPDQDFDLPTNSVTLNGSGTDPDGGSITAYQWTQQSGPNTATLSGATAPDLTASNLVEGTYIYRLTVTDDEDETGFDEVSVSVGPEFMGNPDELWLEAECATVGSNWSVIDDVSASGGQYLLAPTGNNYNSAPTDAGSIISYNFTAESGTYRIYARVSVPSQEDDSFWVRVNNGNWLRWNLIPGNSSFSWHQVHDRENNTVFLTFDLPEGANTIDIGHREDGAGIDKLYVAKTTNIPNGFGAVDANCVTTSEPPIANAGSNMSITLPTNSIVLNGSGNDPDGGSIATYQWTQEDGPNTSSLSGASTADLTVNNLIEGTYVFRLTVTDDENETGFDEISVVINPEVGTQSPTADAGSNQSIDLPTSSITLNGTGTDPDGGSITGYEWTQQSGPNTASLSGATTTELTADNLVEGTYVFRLTVTDDEDETGFDEVSVTVNPEVIPGGFTLRINTGGVATNYSGEDFIADQFSDTGSTLDRPQTGLPEPYQSFRFSRSQVMGYAIPVTDGEYTVRLHFAELWFGATGGGTGGVGSRVFDVSIEGQLVEDDLDVFAEVGADAMLVKTHTVNVTGGVLNIDFSALAAVGGNRHPIINAIEVLGTGSTSQTPMADAGPDQDFDLPTNSVTLNGSGTDPDGGSITAYQWTQQSGPNTATLSGATAPDLTASNLVEGTYIYRLTVTDDEDETGFDEVSVSVGPEFMGNPDELWLEAECATVGSNWSVIDDVSASGGQYLLAPTGNNYNSAPTDAGSIISYNFTAESGTYRIYARVSVPSQEDDSFWVRVNNGNWLRWNLIPGNSSFSWHQVHDRENNTVFLTFDLPEGANTIDIGHREDGAGIDKLYVTKTTKLPSGLGDNALNCSSSGKRAGIVDASESSAVIAETDSSFVIPILYPNPAKNAVTVQTVSTTDISKIHLFDLTGKIIKSYEGVKLNTSSDGIELDLTDVENGIYMMTIVPKSEMPYRLKLIVKK